PIAVDINPAAINHVIPEFPVPQTRTTGTMMNGHPPIPELLEQFMEAGNVPERWITVRELRTHFHLDDTASPAISGFLRRIYQGPYFTCRYRVTRIERLIVNTPHTRMIKRYFVTQRPGAVSVNVAPVPRAVPTQGTTTCESRDCTILEQEDA
ncbi:MAG: hypothetical protein WC295_09450, partial [Methanoregula sp.]